MDKAYVVIMAGGKGERFWPLSNSSHPKQTLALFTGRPLISASVERALALVPAERVFIITSASLVDLMRQIVPELPPDNIIGEPVGRDTAAACALAAGIAVSRDPSAVCTILTADHIISKTALFCETVRKCVSSAESDDAILTIGIPPSFPSTAFGYIEISEQLDGRGNGIMFYKARRFVEKPDSQTAAGYVESGRFFWNSGMFIWKAAGFMTRLKSLAPDLYTMAGNVAKTGTGPALNELMAAEYPGIRRISVDYAVMEHEKNLIMARAPFDWSDVGSWTALADHFAPDESDNVILGNVCQVQSSDNIVVSEKGLTALLGVKDLVVVSNSDVTLVCHKSQAERIKELVKSVSLRPELEKFI